MNSNLIFRIILISLGVFSIIKSVYHFYRTYKQSSFYKERGEK